MIWSEETCMHFITVFGCYNVIIAYVFRINFSLGSKFISMLTNKLQKAEFTGIKAKLCFDVQVK